MKELHFVNIFHFNRKKQGESEREEITTKGQTLTRKEEAK
jgi:hypothetical protein